MFFSSSDFTRAPPRPCHELTIAAQATPCRKKRENASGEEEESSESEEGEVVASEEEDALRLRGGVVRRRKKSPVKRGLDDLWDVNLRAGSARGERLGDDRGINVERPSPSLGLAHMSQANKDGHPPERFDKILYSDLSDESEWTQLGKGSFGCVYKGEYLGIDVAIKEVMSSTDYDVEKYLYREISLMQQARHPNILMYLGLCLAPPPPRDAITADAASRSTRILIISEYLPRGNLRQYILDRTLPFPWRLRMSFSIDIARALSYLHASPRSCMHRDLKGENLLVTENERLKVCDFGLARVVDERSASAEAQKSKPLTYCGTDGYMSPEILLGEPFTLSTDVFSLGVLFIEIASRTLTSQHHFVRSPPDYGLDIAEVHASVGGPRSNCPKRFIDLALRCCDTYPERRPVMREILNELREIEREVLAREDGGEGDAHTRGGGGGTVPSNAAASLKGNVGSISYAGTTKRGSRPGVGGGRTRPSAPRLPSFEGKVKISSSFLGAGATSARGDVPQRQKESGRPILLREGSESEDDDGEALLALAEADVPIDETEDGSPSRKYSTNVLKPRSTIIAGGMVGRPYGTLGSTSGSTLAGSARDESHNRSGSLPSLPHSWVAAHTSKQSTSKDQERPLLDEEAPEADEDEGTRTIIAPSTATNSPSNKLSYLTARTSTLSVANAVVGRLPDEGQPGDEDDPEEARDVFHSAFQHPPAPPPRPPQVDVSGPPLEAPHRFSLIKPGLQRFLGSFSPYAITSSLASSASPPLATSSSQSQWDLSSRLENGTGAQPSYSSGSKCHLCTKKLGIMKAYLACDDCQYACHVKCSDSVAPTCPASTASTPLASPTLALPLATKPTRHAPSPPRSRGTSKDRSATTTSTTTSASKLVKKHPSHSKTTPSIDAKK
ncbi:hypothetical protein JCM11491_004499 [Sporobolomyces phaffii]